MLNFNFIENVGGVEYLADTETRERSLRQFNELVAVYNDCRTFLREGGFPDTFDDVCEVCDRGSNGLLVVVWNRADREAARVGAEKYVMQSWREKEQEAVTGEQWSRADELCFTHSRAANGIRFNRDEDFTEKDGRFVLNTEKVTESVTEATRVEVTDEHRAIAGELKKIVGKIRKRELDGINYMELVNWLLRLNGTPSDEQILNKIIFRRHQPGTIGMAPEIATLINRTALANLTSSK